MKSGKKKLKDSSLMKVSGGRYQHLDGDYRFSCEIGGNKLSKLTPEVRKKLESWGAEFTPESGPRGKIVTIYWHGVCEDHEQQVSDYIDSIFFEKKQ